MMSVPAVLAAVAMAGCASAPAGEGSPAARSVPAASLAAAEGPEARECLPEPTPLEAPGEDPVRQALGHYMRGRLLITQQDTIQAEEELRQAAHLAPRVPRIWLNLGLAQYDAGKVSAAVESLDRALELAPEYTSALYFRGRIAAARGNLSKAADLFGRMTEAAEPKGPHHMLGAYHLARANQNLGNLDAAIAGYRTLLDLLADPQPFFRRYPELYLLYRSRVRIQQQLGALCLSRGKPDEAVGVLAEALEQRPRKADLLDLMCRSQLARKDYEAARRWARRLIEVEAEDAIGYQRLAEAYKAEGKPGRIIPELEKYRAEHPENQALALLLASAYESAGRSEEAAELYRALCRPRDGEAAAPAAALKLADIHMKAGRPVDALDALAATMVDEVIHSAVLVKAAKIIDGLPEKAETYHRARRLVGEDVSHYGPFVLVGMLAEAAGRPNEARALYDKALSRQPKAAIAYSRKADLLIRAKEYDEALSVYRSALGAGLDLPIFHRKMGMLLEELDRLDEAVREYRLARKGAPDDKATAHFLASALARQGRFDEAVAELKRLLKRHPKDLRAHVQLAGVYLGQDNLDAAQDIARRARDLAPDSASAAAVLADVRFRQERYGEAVALAREVLEASPGNESVRLLLVYALAGQNDFEAATAELRAMLAAQPENIDWRYLLAGFYSEMGKSDAAEQELVRILRKKPDHAPSNNDLGYLWADRGVNLPRAEAMIRRALEADPKRPAYLDSLGWVMYKQGRFRDAVGKLEEATRLAPELDPVLWDHLGDSYWRLRRPDDAARAWKTAAEILDKDHAGPKRAGDLRRLRDKIRTVETGGKPPVAPVADPGAGRTPAASDARAGPENQP